MLVGASLQRITEPCDLSASNPLHGSRFLAPGGAVVSGSGIQYVVDTLDNFVDLNLNFLLQKWLVVEDPPPDRVPDVSATSAGSAFGSALGPFPSLLLLELTIASEQLIWLFFLTLKAHFQVRNEGRQERRADHFPDLDDSAASLVLCSFWVPFGFLCLVELDTMSGYKMSTSPSAYQSIHQYAQNFTSVGALIPPLLSNLVSNWDSALNAPLGLFSPAFLQFTNTWDYLLAFSMLLDSI